MTSLSRTVALLTCSALAVGCGGSRSQPVTVHSEGVRIEVAVDPARLRVGENSLWIDLQDAQGSPLTGADLDVRVHMHAMGAMPAMGGPAAVTEVGEGLYRADFELDMGTTWLVEIAAQMPGGPVARAEGSVTVGTAGVRLEGTSMPTPEQTTLAANDTDARSRAEFRIDPGRLQRIGVRTALVERRALDTHVRAVGRVVAEETTLEDVALKVRGWVGEVQIDAVGDPVERGEVLFTVYSPELYAAQEEYLQALRSQERARGTTAPDRSDYLVRAAHNRLRLWDIAASDLEQIERDGEALQHLPIRAPVSGYVVEKNVSRGSAFEPGTRLYRIAPLSRVWVEADIYEFELSSVRTGQRATVTLPYLADRSFEATVAYVYPTLNPKTRTARVRLELPNPDLELRPAMYANVHLHVERGDRLVVPQSAVLYAGERSFVFLSLGDGHFRPQEIAVGTRSGEQVEVLSGVENGDRIVTSGTFLIASESRLRAALEQW